MAPTFHFELVSPEQKLLAEDVTLVTIPGEEGDFGVLAGHAPLLSGVRMGVLRVYKNSMDDIPQRIFVAGGFADVGADHCTILADEATDISNLSVAALDTELLDLKAQLERADTPQSRARIQQLMLRAEAKLALAA